MHFSTLFSAAALSQLALARYVIQDDYMSGGFYDNFEFFTAPDPTRGFVQYVDQATAQSMNLLNASAGAAVGWGVDTVNKDQAGRASVRLTSKKTYNHGLIVVDVEHMPVGCGTWPAFWTVGPNWPNAGEIDIIEGVHEQESNSVALHTGAGCAIGQDTSIFSGEVVTQNCDIKAPGQGENQGCSIGHKDSKSYGAGLNSNGGGVFATEWTSEAITVWFFARGAIAAGVLGENPDPSTWGKPAARFENTGCEIDSFFKDQRIVFDTTFCGDWAGNTWSDSCAAKTGVQTCNDYVRDNPEAFSNAFWTVNALKVYSDDGSVAPAPSSSVQPGQSTDAPVTTPDAPVTTPDIPVTTPDTPSIPTTADVPVPSSSGFESPPTIDPSEVPADPSTTREGAPVPSETKPRVTRTRFHTRTRHGDGDHGGYRTQEMQRASAETATPSLEANKGSMGGFTWPAGKPSASPPGTTATSAGNSTLPATTAVNSPVPTGNATLPTTTVINPPFPSGNNTLPTTTDIVAPGPSGSQRPSSVDFNTVSSFSTSMPAGIPSATVPAAAPTSDAMPAPTLAVPSPVDTIPVTAAPVGEASSTSCTKVHPQPAETAAAKMARHARNHRRRMVKHHARK